MILALDQGTTSSRAIVFDRRGNPVAVSQKEITQYYPQPGWVEHDPEEIWTTQLEAARQAILMAGATGRIEAIGITNQRETTVLWDRETGVPVHRAIVWQDRRTADLCSELKRSGVESTITACTGLLIDSYFTATKLAWLLDNIPGLRARAESGQLAFGTVDSFLVWRLTGGKRHVTDVTNAGRTMLFDINRHVWSPDLLKLFGIPLQVLPAVVGSSEVVGLTDGDYFGVEIPIAGIAGDQQAATFGQACFHPGMAKSTYGTGCFLLMNTGTEARRSRNRLLTTPAASRRGKVYALEGSVFIAGAAVQWLRDEMGLIRHSSDAEEVATSISDTAGVYVVPAFAGLGAPYWDSYARGAIVGLTRGTGRRHIVRATLESIAYQCRDVLDAMTSDLGAPLREIRVDGGASANNFLMQFQADILGIPVVRPKCTETTALGAAMLAGLAVGYWAGEDELEAQWSLDRTFAPAIPESKRSELYEGWRNAVSQVRTN